MKSGYRYDAKTCFRCGHLVHYNWYIRHRRSGCVLGIVVAPSNNGFHADRASGPDNSEDLPETRPAGEPDR